MKSVLISVQPYWVFLIIAKTMGWNIDKEKTVEVRKNYPKSNDWNKVVKIYCSKDKKSFAKIPKEYQPLMEQFLGKVIGEFVCEGIEEYYADDYAYGTYEISDDEVIKTCLVNGSLWDYGKGQTLYGWHISNLVIYDKPKELSEFYVVVENEDCGKCKYYDTPCESEPCNQCQGGRKYLTRPPQSWCYVESEVDVN